MLDRLRRSGWLAIAFALACGARSDPLIDDGPVDARASRCGNLIVEDGEDCDDGNLVETDACRNVCAHARCGDGVIEPLSESCDDANGDDSDGCRSDCTLASCGNGVVERGEDCDDGGASDACSAQCRFHHCGDGIVAPVGEECDEGPANGSLPALAVVQGSIRPALPIVGSLSVADHYGYSSASAHTGFEVVRESRLYFYQQIGAAGIAIVTVHGIDDDSGEAQPKSRVEQRFSSLPAGSGVAVADDKPEEFQSLAPDVVLGRWHFDNNTDGGVLGDLPFPGTWVVHVEAEFELGIDVWRFLDVPRNPQPLERDAPADLVAYADGPSCRIDCTLVRCGDGQLDAGEVCDDGNTAAGDGCSPDCQIVSG